MSSLSCWSPSSVLFSLLVVSLAVAQEANEANEAKKIETEKPRVAVGQFAGMLKFSETQHTRFYCEGQEFLFVFLHSDGREYFGSFKYHTAPRTQLERIRANHLGKSQWYSIGITQGFLPVARKAGRGRRVYAGIEGPGASA